MAISSTPLGLFHWREQVLSGEELHKRWFLSRGSSQINTIPRVSDREGNDDKAREDVGQFARAVGGTPKS